MTTGLKAGQLYFEKRIHMQQPGKLPTRDPKKTVPTATLIHPSDTLKRAHTPQKESEVCSTTDVGCECLWPAGKLQRWAASCLHCMTPFSFSDRANFFLYETHASNIWTRDRPVAPRAWLVGNLGTGCGRCSRGRVASARGDLTRRHKHHLHCIKPVPVHLC
jgi:hypothetical protein